MNIILVGKRNDLAGQSDAYFFEFARNRFDFIRKRANEKKLNSN